MGLCSQAKSTEQRLEAMKWYFGKRHCRLITFSATDSDLGASFPLNVISHVYAEKKYLVFLDDGVAVAPVPAAGVTLVTATVTIGDSQEDKAIAVELALISANVEARTLVENDALEVQNWFVGKVTAEVFPITITVLVQAIGFGGYIGQTGESELTTTVEVVQLVDDAQGSVIQDEIITGYGAEISIPLKEMTTQRWKDLVGEVTGNNISIDTKDITGWGTKKLYQSMFNYAGRLIGHPVRNAYTAIDEDIVMLNTAPKMESINFSGAAIQEATFMFTSYKDANAAEEINLVARGDHTKF
jgi:hypothetical protein